jgi:hypothetical protein
MLLTAAMLPALTSAAAAGSYLSLGIGNRASIGGEPSAAVQSEEGRSGRVAIGQRFGPLAIEAAVFGSELGTSPTGPDASLVSASAEVKYHVTLSGGLELYVKGGLDHGWLGVDGQGVVDEGQGTTVGGGLQYRVEPGLLGNAAIWLDYTHQEIELAGGTTTLGMANLGVSVGL